MRLSNVWLGSLMTARELLRSRITLLLLFVVPTLFYTLVALTTPDKDIAFQLASLSRENVMQVSRKEQSLIFVGLAAVGLLTAFVAMNLIQKNDSANRRLVLCGFGAIEVVLSKLLVLGVVALLVGIYASALLLFFFRPDSIVGTALGFALGGWVYGCYGLLVGALLRRELEAILLVVLLANIDAGWLQNPIYYADAQNTAIIRSLPAYFPSQACMIAAFTRFSTLNPTLWSLAYAAGLLALALFFYSSRVRIAANGRHGHAGS
jgi:uncharacterized membrane protein YidH (DUF202 family)